MPDGVCYDRVVTTRPWGLALLIAVSGCDSIPAPGGLPGLNVGDAKRVGDCELRLVRAAYYHSESWNLEIEVTLANRGVEDKRCGWEATLVSGSQQALTETTGGPQTLPPGESVELARIAKEKNMTGFSGGPSDGDWVLVTVSEGMPMVGASQQFHATPDRVRPPS